MKILLWHGYLLGGTGSNVYTRALAREWRRAGHDVTVLSQEPQPGLYDLGGASTVRPDVGGLLPVFVLPARRMGSRMADLQREASTLNAGMTTQMTERFSAGGATLVKLFGRPDAEAAEFARRAGRVRDIGVRVAMLHDSGAAPGRGRRLRRRFPDADVVVFGHSHIPWNEVYDGQLAFNPGSPTDKRRQPRGTVGLLLIEGGELVQADIVAVT